MGKAKALRVDHGPIDEDIVDSLTDQEKEWLRSWNRHDEIPGEDAPEADDDEETAEDDGYDGLTNAELQELLKARGLPTSGNKDDLVARLEEDDEEEE